MDIPNDENVEARTVLAESINLKQVRIDDLSAEADGFDRRAKSRRDEAGVLDAEIHGLEIALEGLGGRIPSE